jgi:membrane protease YdiL (CAAX protease family)
METGAVVAIVAGIAAQAGAWWLVGTGVPVWRVAPPVFVACGVLGALVGDPRAFDHPDLPGPDASPPVAIAVGLGGGVALYLGTVAFTAVAVRWGRFRDDTIVSYERAASASLATALVLTAVSVVGEELFWRGLVQVELSRALDGWVLAAALATAGLYVVANAASRSRPILAASIVGGTWWAVLAVLTGSLVAPGLSHLVWTWLMLASPPRVGRGMMST